MLKEKYTLMTIAVLIIATTITTTIVYGVSPKSLCTEYGGDWSNGKCKGLSGEDKAEYEDAVCDEYGRFCKIQKNLRWMIFWNFYNINIICFWCSSFSNDTLQLRK